MAQNDVRDDAADQYARDVLPLEEVLGGSARLRADNNDLLSRVRQLKAGSGRGVGHSLDLLEIPGTRA
jgi:hypothetical protein